MLLYQKKTNYFEKTSFAVSMTYKNKVEIYQNLGFPVIPQEKKFNGFEKIKDIYMSKYNHLITPEFKLKNPFKYKWSPYELLLRSPYEQKIGLFSYKGILNDDV
jgi:hypothetical protein